MSSKNTTNNNNNTRAAGQFEQKETDTAAAIPSSVSSSTRSSSVAAISTHRSTDASYNKTAPAATPLAFVEKDILDEQQEGSKIEGRTASPLLPETITSTSVTSTTGDHQDPQQPPTTNHIDYDNNNNNNRVIIKSEVSSLANTDASDNHKRTKSSMALVKSEDNDDVHTHMGTRRSRRKRKQPHSSSTMIPTNDSVQTKKKKRNINQQGGEPAVVNNTNRRTSPRNKKHKKEHKKEQEEDQKDNTTTTTSTIDNNDYSNDNESNCCRFCNDLHWENRIYYKCGTAISKYFPKSDNNPNPGWYKGTIRMHHISSSNSYSEYEEEADSSSEEESVQQCTVLNEIHYEDGDMENITQDNLKLQLVGGGRVKILHSTKKPTASNLECRNGVDDAPLLTLSNNKHDRNWLKIYHRLKKYKEENGHCLVPQRYDPDPSLGKWVNKQRQHYKKGTLAPDREEKLKEIGFEWDDNICNRKWLKKYQRLQQFKAENGHCRVPQNYGQDPSLANWVHVQRKFYNKGNITEDRKEKLNKIGFDWDPFGQTWDEMFCRLEHFKTENLHCRVPQRHDPDPSLGIWAGKQRQHYKKGTLAPDRAEKLEEIGFEWNPRNYGNTERET